MTAAAPAPDPAPDAPLDAGERARGRRLAIASHPAGMTHRTVFNAELPTLALVALGASEAAIGFQRALLPLAFAIQLPALRLLGRASRRSVLVWGHVAALAGSVPLLFFGALPPGASGVAVALAAFGAVSLGLAAGDTAWFALLRGYQEPDRTGRFFAALRATWHLALIVYFLAAQRWLSAHPGAFAPLFIVGFALGVLRLLLIVRLPERRERNVRPPRAREALALLVHEPRLRRYLAGVALAGTARGVGFAFALVLLRRLGMSEGDALWTTLAIYVGGLVALPVFGRLTDVVGPVPVFRWTAVAQAVLVLALVLVDGAGAGDLALAVALFFAVHAAAAGFDVADTHVLFALTPEHAPLRTIVVAQAVDRTAKALTPLVAGLALERALAAHVEPLTAYRALFAACALATLLALLPLSGLGQRPTSRESS